MCTHVDWKTIVSASRFTFVNYCHHRGVFELNVYLLFLPVDVAGVVELLPVAAAGAAAGAAAAAGAGAGASSP